MEKKFLVTAMFLTIWLPLSTMAAPMHILPDEHENTWNHFDSLDPCKVRVNYNESNGILDIHFLDDASNINIIITKNNTELIAEYGLQVTSSSSFAYNLTEQGQYCITITCNSTIVYNQTINID